MTRKRLLLIMHFRFLYHDMHSKWKKDGMTLCVTETESMHFVTFYDKLDNLASIPVATCLHVLGHVMLTLSVV